MNMNMMVVVQMTKVSKVQGGRRCSRALSREQRKESGSINAHIYTYILTSAECENMLQGTVQGTAQRLALWYTEFKHKLR
jgi:hypothetical protein